MPIICRCSTIGPSASDGRNVNAPIIRTTPTSIAMNKGVWVGNVPAVVATPRFAARLPAIRLHDLRHSYATAALAAGIPAKVVSERLGHATIAITMDTYSHVLPGMDERAASAVARLILGDKTAPGEGAVNNL